MDNTVPTAAPPDSARLQQQILHLLIDQLPIGVQIFDTNGNCTKVNEAHLRIFGVQKTSDLAGKYNLFDDPLAQETGTAAAGKIALQGQMVHLPEVPFDFGLADERFATTEGYRVLSVTFFPVRDQTGENVQLVALNEDITERKRVEAELRLSDEILRQMPDAIVVTDLANNITHWMGMAEQMFGYTAEEVLGKPIDFIVPPNIRQTTIAEIIDVVQRTGRYFGEVTCAKKDGTNFPVEVMSKIGYNPDGSPMGYIIISRDISERKHALRAIRQAETNYQTLVEQLPAITYVQALGETESRMIYISPQVESLLGFTQVEWLANPNLWFEQIYPLDRTDVLAEFDRSVTAGEGLNIEYRMLTHRGRIMWFRNQTTLLGENGTPRLAHGIMFDITHQKMLEEQLRHIQKMEAVGQMAGGIAHNFNNVLTALLGHAELALDGLPEDHPVRFDVERVKKNAQRAASLTQQLLAFTRNEENHPQSLNLTGLIFQLDDLLRQLINSSVDLLIEPPSETLWEVKADPGQIQEVLVHLVLNASDAMPLGGKLTIKMTNVALPAGPANQQFDLAPGDYVLFTVSDTGHGIAPEIESKIFEPFFTTKEVGQATGLGLSTCFGIIKQNKGHISFDSTPDKGTTFKVFLPKANIRSKTEMYLKAINLQTTQKQHPDTILLVEDSAVLRSMATRILTKHGYHVTEASNGEEALEIINQHPRQFPDLLITDLSMPRIGGDKLAQQVKTLRPSTKVLLISGFTDRALKKRGVHQIDFTLLPKPFTPDLLIEKVNLLLAKK